MFLTPNKIADFTDEVAKSRIKIFQLWRKLLAFTFRFIKKHPVQLVFYLLKNIMNLILIFINPFKNKYKYI